MSKRPKLAELRERARHAPREWSPPEWLRRVLTLEELEDMDSALPTCWVGVFCWWQSGSMGWNVTEDCFRGEPNHPCYCGKYDSKAEAREAAERWSSAGKQDWRPPQQEAWDREAEERRTRDAYERTPDPPEDET